MLAVNKVVMCWWFDMIVMKVFSKFNNSIMLWSRLSEGARLSIIQWKAFGLPLNASNPFYSIPQCIWNTVDINNSWCRRTSIYIHSRHHRKCLQNRFIGICSNSDQSFQYLKWLLPSEPWTGSYWRMPPWHSTGCVSL